jgi:hypothetical protein
MDTLLDIVHSDFSSAYGSVSIPYKFAITNKGLAFGGAWIFHKLPHVSLNLRL